MFGLTQPYGISTPNRQGFDLDFFYRDSVNIVNFLVGSSYLTDLTGEGTENLRSYIQFRFKAKLLINKLINLNRQITIHAGLKSDRVNRSHPEELFVDNVNVNSILLDAGTEVELFKKFNFLIAYKKLGVNGTDYLGVRNEDFSISSFELFDVDSKQEILSAGFSYDFNKKTTFLINFQRIGYDNMSDLNSFSFNQFFALLQLRF